MNVTLTVSTPSTGSTSSGAPAPPVAMGKTQNTRSGGLWTHARFLTQPQSRRCQPCSFCASGAEEHASVLTNEVSTSKHTHTHAQTWHTIAAAAATRVQHESSHLPTVIALGCASVLRAVEVHLQGTVHPIRMCQIPAVHCETLPFFSVCSQRWSALARPSHRMPSHKML